MTKQEGRWSPIRWITLAVLVLAASLGWSSASVAQTKKGVLRVGINAAELPTLTGQPTQGGTGFRWTGWTVFDSLVYWDINQDDHIPVEKPYLAEEYYPKPDDKSKWVFKLRRGVKFHDGSDFNADAVIWNLEKLFKKDAPQYDVKQISATSCCMMDVKGWTKIDDYTVEIDTGTPNAMLPYRLPWFRIASPTQWKKLGSWDAFEKHPSGTGPFKVAEVTPGQRAVLVRNDAYWNKERLPKVERMELLPIADHNTRTAALLSGQVDFIESPPPDMLPRLQSSGMQIVRNRYPHIWPYILRVAGDATPFKDVRVRKAINLAVDRDGMVKLLGGNALPAKGLMLPESSWFGTVDFKIRYAPDEAKKLLQEAGYGPSNPLKFTALISPGGSGQMQPLPMNEFIQQNLKAIGVDLTFKVVEWQTLRTMRNKGPLDPSNVEIHAVNNSWETSNPAIGMESLFASWKTAPAGVNWGVNDPELDALIKKILVTFDRTEQDELMRKAHKIVVDNAYWLFVVHDINLHAMSPRVKGFKPAISWNLDYTQISVE
ncbi:MAG: ABC transporter substrate-binding protein [Variibacter sp.]